MLLYGTPNEEDCWWIALTGMEKEDQSSPQSSGYVHTDAKEKSHSTIELSYGVDRKQRNLACSDIKNLLEMVHSDYFPYVL